ncbi:MAG: lipopolysaccharide biosynthesis protein, partial [Egibacteraceae bacterium]
SDLVYSAMTASNAVLLGRYGGAVEVASFRAIQPAARLNQVVFTSFTLLFTPLAARLFARGDREGINDLYWQTAIWVAIFSFPLFSLTFSLAQPLTASVYGSRYADSAVYLALLSLGYYFNAALGFNGLTLKVFGIVRYIVVLNLAAASANLALNFLLIPRFGALGAAVGTCATLVVHNLLKQWGLRYGTGIALFEWRYARLYLFIAANALVLWLIQLVFSPGLVTTVGLAALSSLAVFRLGRSELNIHEVFPELLRVPFGRRLFGADHGT